jgi:hypothetical protein
VILISADKKLVLTSIVKQVFLLFLLLFFNVFLCASLKFEKAAAFDLKFEISQTEVAAARHQYSSSCGIAKVSRVCCGFRRQCTMY